MNDKGRKYLSERIVGIQRGRVREAEALKVTLPSLQNYLISALLQGEAVFANSDGLKSRLESSTKQMGANIKLITDKLNDKWTSESSPNWFKDAPYGIIGVPVELLFELPEAYLKQRDLAIAHNANVNVLIRAINAWAEAALLKVNVGTDKSLEPLVEQISAIQDLNTFGLLTQGNQIDELKASAELLLGSGCGTSDKLLL